MNYWLESLECSMDDHGVLDSIPKEIREKIARDIELSAQMESQYTGRDIIANPMESEVRELKRLLQEQKNKTEKIESDFIKNVARRWNVDETRVHLEGDGDVTVYP